MATKLKNLRIRKVDFVDEGANPDADIKMKKRKEGEGQAGGTVGGAGPENIWKKLFRFIGKVAGMTPGEIDSAVEEIQKGDSISFNEKMLQVENQKIADEIWNTCYALQSSLCSILNDGEMDSVNMETTMRESLDEFYSLAQESIKEWSGGRAVGIVRKKEGVSEPDLEIMKAAVKRLNAIIEKTGEESGPEGEFNKEGTDYNENSKGDEEEMKIDKSKLTDAERAFLESIEKRCGTGDEDVARNGGSESAPAIAPGEPKVTKSVTYPTAEAAAPTEEADSIYKGLHPDVRAELEGLKKFREDAEARELAGVAKKYAIIGKKEEELVPLFKSLKAAGGSAYNDMIAILDQAVATVEKSGAFSEIGKSGHGFGTPGTVETKIEAIAKGYMEKDTSLDHTSAVAKAWEDNPDLMEEYEAEAGF